MASIASVALLASCSSNDTTATVPSSTNAAIAPTAPTTMRSTTTVDVVPDSPPDNSPPASTTTTADVTDSSAATTLAPPTSPPPTTVPGEVFESVEEEIAARYVGFWDARFVVNSADAVGEPSDPRLAEYATGAQLEQVMADTQRFAEQGLRLARPPQPADFRQVEVVSIDGDTAMVQECYVDDGLLVDRTTGDVVNDAVSTHNVSATMHRIDGVWKVEAARLIQRWEGVEGCALAS